MCIDAESASAQRRVVFRKNVTSMQSVSWLVCSVSSSLLCMRCRVQSRLAMDVSHGPGMGTRRRSGSFLLYLVRPRDIATVLGFLLPCFFWLPSNPYTVFPLFETSSCRRNRSLPVNERRAMIKRVCVVSMVTKRGSSVRIVRERE